MHFNLFKRAAGIVLAFSLPIALLSWSDQKGKPDDLQVPVTYYKLPNGLKVVLSPDKTAPTIAVGVYYNIGFRIEPKNRTGFAHLFEHMMFQGSENLGKMEFIQLVQKNGGILNGSTRFDFTNYFEVMPAHKLETALWAEADRMKGLKITQENLTNQQGVVKNEVKVNVLNQPYGGFPWLDMPQYANKNWYNAHNFYGDLNDLDSAKLEDVDNFFKTFYAPNNAVLVVSGDFDIPQAKKWVDQYFAKIPASTLPPKPDLTEPKQEAELRFTKEDKLAKKPAIAISYKMPERNTPEYYAMGLLDQILGQGQDSRLYQALVQQKGYTSGVSAGINIGLGNMFDYNGPMLWTSNLIYDTTVKAEAIIKEYDQTISDLVNTISADDLQLAIVKMRSGLYDAMGGTFGIGKVNLLACFALFDDDPSRINKLESEFKKVTPELIRSTAKTYLSPNNRTILIIEPAKASK
ncbi:MAG TPA: pitrilysin family protein [Flavisolibacter sp.]|jgi:predicted Zn-dependent peptidase|nr:pitrilysin family protein [Flavisolibacter sp.]